jgi:hypothetical protein
MTRSTKNLNGNSKKSRARVGSEDYEAFLDALLELREAAAALKITYYEAMIRAVDSFRAFNGLDDSAWAPPDVAEKAVRSTRADDLTKDSQQEAQQQARSRHDGGPITQGGGDGQAESEEFKAAEQQSGTAAQRKNRPAAQAHDCT